jgi:hypothetical protein
MSEQPGEQLDEEPQEVRGAPGSRDTGSDQPGGGPVDRPQGTVDEGPPSTVDPQEVIDPQMPNPIGDGGTTTEDAGPLGGPGEVPPQDTGRAVPPYPGRRESAEVDTSGESVRREGAHVGGATGPVEDAERKAPDPSDTPGGAVASPADEQPADEQRADERSADERSAETPGEPSDTGPAHSAGVRRAEDQR